MIKQLYTNGCSWTHGGGLNRDPSLGSDWPSYAWPSRLGKLLDIPVKNESMGGGSNARIVRFVSAFARELPPEDRASTLVVIGWTVTDRDEVYIDEAHNWYPFNNSQEFQGRSYGIAQCSQPMIEDVERVRKQYVANLMSTYANNIRFLNQVFLVKNLLENLGISFLFFQSLPWCYPNELIGKNLNESDSLKTNFKNLESNNVMDLDRTFNEFVLSNGHRMTECYHPHVDGHQAWAEFLFAELTKRSIIHD